MTRDQRPSNQHADHNRNQQAAGSSTTTTNNNTNNYNQHAQDKNTGVRVIVVGRTELIPRLRRRPGVELIRAHDGSAAIAELASPIDESSPEPCVIIVGRTSDPTDNDATEFNTALKRVNTTVRTAAVANTRDPSAYDEALDEHLSDEALDNFLARATAKSTTKTTTHANTTIHTNQHHHDTSPTTSHPTQPTPNHPATPQNPKTTAISAANPTIKPNKQHQPTQRILNFNDPLPPALDAIREASAPHPIYFSPDSADELPANITRLAPVVYNNTRLGWLGSTTLDAKTLSIHADQLARWITLGRRQRALRKAAYTDPLTGAYNRRYFDKFMERAIQRARDDRNTVAVLLFDLDNFKTFNDRFGHAAGDNILVHTVRLLRSVIRPTDRVCRIGGDEFVVIFTEPDGPRDANSKPLTPESIKQLAKRFQQQISKHHFPELGAHAPGQLSISGGLATYPWDGSDPETLLKRADQLALRCKNAGKNLIDLGPNAERAE